MTYNVFGGTLNLAQSNPKLHCVTRLPCVCNVHQHYALYVLRESRRNAKVYWHYDLAYWLLLCGLF